MKKESSARREDPVLLYEFAERLCRAIEEKPDMVTEIFVTMIGGEGRELIGKTEKTGMSEGQALQVILCTTFSMLSRENRRNKKRFEILKAKYEGAGT